MENCVCFRCNKKYSSPDIDDIAGDGRCPTCKEIAVRAAIKVEHEVAQLNAARFNNPHQAIMRDILKDAEDGRAVRVNARDLGLSSWGS